MNALPGPHDVLDFWLGDTPRSAEQLEAFNRRWFKQSDEFDGDIRSRFLILLESLAAGDLTQDWADRGPRERLAAIIVLDQFSRNLFRGSARAFAQDSLALRLCKDGLALGLDSGLSETERVFFYLPLEHSEGAPDQARSVELFAALAREARPGFQAFTKSTLDYAIAHKDAIDRFGRFPHRNATLGRASTPDEIEWLAEGGGF